MKPEVPNVKMFAQARFEFTIFDAKDKMKRRTRFFNHFDHSQLKIYANKEQFGPFADFTLTCAFRI